MGKHLRVVLALAEVYSTEAMLAALVAAREYNTYSHRFVQGLLEASDATRRGSASGSAMAGATAVSTAGTGERLLPFAAVPLLRVTADLGVYQRVLESVR